MGEEERNTPVDTITHEVACISFDKRLENVVHCLVNVPTRMERDGGMDLRRSFE